MALAAVAGVGDTAQHFEQCQQQATGRFLPPVGRQRWFQDGDDQKDLVQFFYVVSVLIVVYIGAVYFGKDSATGLYALFHYKHESIGEAMDMPFSAVSSAEGFVPQITVPSLHHAVMACVAPNSDGDGGRGEQHSHSHPQQHPHPQQLSSFPGGLEFHPTLLNWTPMKEAEEDEDDDDDDDDARMEGAPHQGVVELTAEEKDEIYRASNIFFDAQLEEDLFEVTIHKDEKTGQHRAIHGCENRSKKQQQQQQQQQQQKHQKQQQKRKSESSGLGAPSSSAPTTQQTDVRSLRILQPGVLARAKQYIPLSDDQQGASKVGVASKQQQQQQQSPLKAAAVGSVELKEKTTLMATMADMLFSPAGKNREGRDEEAGTPASPLRTEAIRIHIDDPHGDGDSSGDDGDSNFDSDDDDGRSGGAADEDDVDEQGSPISSAATSALLWRRLQASMAAARESDARHRQHVERFQLSAAHHEPRRTALLSQQRTAMLFQQGRRQREWPSTGQSMGRTSSHGHHGDREDEDENEETYRAAAAHVHFETVTRGRLG